MCRSALVVLCATTLLIGAGGCSRSNNLLLGRVEATVDGHRVVVTDCYRTSAPVPEESTLATDGKPQFRFAPCQDAVIVIHGADLRVNDIAYGPLAGGDSVTVDHGKVLINDRPAVSPAGG